MSILLSTCSLISSSVSVITGVKQINAKLSTILQPHKGLRVAERDRRKLVSIHRRVECLIQPLDFCVMWSRNRQSCIKPIIQYSFDLVQSVMDFLDKLKFVTDDLDPFTRTLDTESAQKVDHFLRELEFACTSVSMAVSISRSSVNEGPREQVSPSSLLRASKRISEMCNRSGDLFTISGVLYKRDSPLSPWFIHSSDSSLRISQFRSVDPIDSPYLFRLTLTPDKEGLNFPIETALSLQVSTVKLLDLPSPSVVDSHVLFWKFCEMTSNVPKRRFLHRNPSGEDELSRLSLDSSDDDSIIVHGAAEVPSALRPRISSTHIAGSEMAAEYAFSVGKNSSQLSHLDMVYIARLCVIESVRTVGTSTGLMHLEASDETLSGLLIDSEMMQEPITMRISSAAPADSEVSGL